MISLDFISECMHLREHPSDLMAPDLNGLRLKTWKHVAPGSQRLVLVGDQCQLPPTVQSTEVCFGGGVWQVEEVCECVAGETMIIAPDIADADCIQIIL